MTVSANLPIHAGVEQSRAIAERTVRGVERLFMDVRVQHSDLDRSIVLSEFMLATRRWLATHDTYRCGHGDLVDQDTHVLQTLFAEIALELTARGRPVTYSVGVPDPDEPEQWAVGTGVSEVVK